MELTEEEKKQTMEELGKRNYGLPYDSQLLKRLYEKQYGPIVPIEQQVNCFSCLYSWKTKSQHIIVQYPSCYRRIKRPRDPEEIEREYQNEVREYFLSSRTPRKS
jgi:hypothetical protein